MNNKYSLLAAFPFPKKIEEVYHIYVSRFIFKEFTKIQPDSLALLKKFNLKHITIIIINSDESTEQSRTVRLEDIDVIFLKQLEFFDSANIRYFFSKVLEEQTNMFFLFKETTWIEILVKFRVTGIIVSSGSVNKKGLLSPIQFKLALFAALYKGSDALNTIINSYFSKERNNFVETKLGVDWTSKELHKVLKEGLPENTPFLEDHNFPIKTDINNKNYNLLDSKEIDPSNKNSPFNTNGQKREYHKSKLLNNKQINSNKFNKDITLLNFLDSVKEIINNPNLTPYQAQETIENCWFKLIELKISEDTNIVKKNINKLTSLLRRCEETLNLYTEHKLLAKKFINFKDDLNKFEYIVVAFSFGLTYYNRINYTTIAVIIGKHIYYLIYKKRREQAIKQNCDIEFPSFINWLRKLKINSDRECVKLGDFFLSMLSTFPSDLFEREVNEKYTRTKHGSSVLIINSEHVDAIKDNIVIYPATLPMICKPEIWDDTHYGGFLENAIRKDDLITNKEKHTMENRKPLYDAINYLNSIEFSINSLLFNFLKNDGEYLLNEVKTKDTLQRNITLQVAETYLNKTFYLNVRADWRGRIYADSFYVNYQGSDLSSALLNFNNGEVLTEVGKYYLYVYGANQHNQNNISKTSFKDRFNWVENNYEKIINLDRELILSAEKPFMFTTFCLNIKEIHNNPNYLVKLPIFLDATCNGIQHLSAILQDLELGVKTNLIIDGENDQPRDIYTEVITPINKAINDYGKENPDFNSLYSVELNRKILKQSIMTLTYNVTRFGIKEQLKSKFELLKIDKNDEINLSNADYFIEDDTSMYNNMTGTINSEIKNNLRKSRYFYIAPGKNGTTVELTNNQIFKIATIISEQIFVLFPSLNNIYKYFIDISKLIIKLGIPLTWITPTGMKITQHYIKTKSTSISIRFAGKTKKITLREWTDILDIRKQTQAIIPNIIHSLDANHLIKIINSAKEDNLSPIISIHDCFGTHPNKMGELEFKIKKEFILLYTNENFINTFHNRIIQSITDNNINILTINNKNYVEIENEDCTLVEIPNVPKLGELDLNNIIHAKYMVT
jgi:DNA-dependent RNA polymerase